MKRTRALAITLGLAMSATVVSWPASAQEAVGDWSGQLEVGRGNQLPLIVHIFQDEVGKLGGTLDSPAQGASGIALGNVVAEGANLTFDVPSIGGRFVGRWDEGAGAWRGEWTQGGSSLPLVLAVPSRK